MQPLWTPASPALLRKMSISPEQANAISRKQELSLIKWNMQYHYNHLRRAQQTPIVSRWPLKPYDIMGPALALDSKGYIKEAVLKIWHVHWAGVVSLCSYLTVSDGGVSESIRCQDSPEGSNPQLVLEGWVLWHGTVQVSLNLLCGKVILSHWLFHQICIVSRMSHHLIPGPCNKQLPIPLFAFPSQPFHSDSLSKGTDWGTTWP